MPARASVPVELEAKLLARDAALLAAIAARANVDGYPLQRRGTVRLYTRYLDSDDFVLTRRRVALRLRRCGDAWEATVKWSGQVRGLVHRRPELTVPLRRAPGRGFRLPSGPLREQLAPLLGRRPLRTILITDIQRTVLDVLPRGRLRARSLAEIALDRVALRGPRAADPRETYYEVEIEQRIGAPRVVARLAEVLRAEYRLVPSPHSKFARGMALVHGFDT